MPWNIVRRHRACSQYQWWLLILSRVTDRQRLQPGDVTRNDVIYQAIHAINRRLLRPHPVAAVLRRARLSAVQCPPTRRRDGRQAARAISRKIMQSAVQHSGPGRLYAVCGIGFAGISLISLLMVHRRHLELSPQSDT